MGSGMGAGWMGAGTPMQPVAPPEVAGRRFDYPFSSNTSIRTRAYEPIGFIELRGLADGHDLTRLAIETRKDQMARLQFNFVPVDKKTKMEDGSELATRARRMQDIFRRPDRRNFWSSWLRMVLEDLLVIDAPAIHVRRTRGGDLYSLDQLDGATIKPIIDDMGRAPEPPFAAYQQILKGLPAVNYTSRDLIYLPRNRRVHKFYGMSPVEQIVMTVNIALRRQMWQLSYFTDGNLPDSLIGVPSTWTPDQIRQFQDWFDSILSGNTGARRSARFVPGEVAKSYVPTKEAEIFGAAEEWIARVVCFCFGISHQALVKEVNRATADTSQEQAISDGLAPIMGWVKELIDGILLDEFGETELEFQWIDDKELDPKIQSEIHTAQTGNATMTRNEARAERGLDPDPAPEADMLGTFGPTGFVPLSTEDAIKLKTLMQDAFPPPPVLGGPEVDENGKPVKTDEEGKPLPGALVQEPTDAEDDPEDAPVGKAAGASSGLSMPSMQRPLARRAQRSLARIMTTALRTLGDDVAAQVERVLGVKKSDWSVDLEEILRDIDFSILSGLPEEIMADLERVGADAAIRSLGMLGVDKVEDLFDRVNERAVNYARSRAAELVGRQVLPSGHIVDNPSPKWSITETTREGIRDMITRSLEENLGSDAIIEELQESFLFSPERAEMVSRTEIASANSQGAMEGYRAAASTGIVVLKEWILGPNPCEVCEANAAQGPIPLDEDFESGDDAVPAHPHCECAVIPVVGEDGE